MAKKFWSFRNIVETNKKELVIEGPISEESWWGDEATPSQLRQELAEFNGNELTVSLNSGGGDVFAGLAMYNALRELDAKVTIRVDGLAASIASIIAMAGDTIIMSPGSLMMIHRPSVFAGGNVDDLDKAKEVLLKIEESITPIYSERSGLSIERIAELLEAETWMTADEAVEMGFADEAIHKSDIKATIQNALNTNFAFSMKSTEESLRSLVEKITASEEKEEEDVVKPTETETPVETATADEAEIKETETPEVVEAEVEEIKQSTEKENEMTDNKEIATSQVIEPAAQAPVEVKADMKSYLKSQASVEAFANILVAQAGKTSEDVRAAWKDHLEATMGVTNPEIFLPDALISKIEDAFKAGGEIWNRVSKSGVDVFKASWDIEDDVNSEDGRGRGYNRADEENKAEQVLEFAERVIRPQFVYKYIQLNKEDVKNQRSTGALVTYVLTELPKRIIREIERAIVIGDGRLAGSDYKISSFVSIKADATANNVFASTYVATDPTESRYASLLQARDLVEADGEMVLVCKKGYLTQLLLEQNINGGFLFAPGTNLGAILGFSAVIEPDWMASDADNDAYIVTFANYKTVGDNSIEAFTNFRLEVNKQQYLQEIWAGGALTGRKSAVAIPASTVS